jgi:hypothetical protein
VTEMRPDVHSDEAGAESEYGNDTGFAAEATRVPDAPDPEVDSAQEEEPGNGAD